MKRDIRSLVFVKSAIDNTNFVKLNKSETSDIENGFRSYISFGEYDALYTHKVSDKDNDMLFSIIKENGELTKSYDGTIFLHPLYAVLNCEDEKEENKVSSFWNANESNFIFVSSVYLKGLDLSCENIFRFKENLKNCLGDNLPFSYLVYQSLDLSDFIIIWKSNTVGSVINSIQKIYKEAELNIGYISTICAADFLHVSADDNSFLKYENDIDINDYVDIANIYSISSPYSEESTESTKNRFDRAVQKKSANESFFVLGNEDFVNTIKNIKTREFFRILHNVYKTTIVKPEPFESINRTFTQIGLSCSRDSKIVIPNPNEDKKSIQLYYICKNLHKRFLSLKSKKVFEDLEWINVSIELTNLMTVMSQSDIFKSLNLLLIDSVNFFCSWLEYLEEKFREDNFVLSNKLFNDDESIQSFVRSWKQLIDNVVHSDGVSVQIPGYSIFSNNIFNSTVEYCGCYFNALTSLFFEIEGLPKESIQISYIISPKLCRRIKTAEMFFETQNKDSLLSIEIPILDMLNPFIILTSLTHEAAHYCGEETRSKEKRKKSFIMCVAQIILDSLGLTNKNAYERLFNIIYQRVNQLNDYSLEQLYLNDLSDCIKISAKHVLSSFDGMNELINCSLPNESIENEERISSIVSSSYDLLNDKNSIAEHIDRIKYFLKECYADVMMIKILNLSFTDYVRVLSLEFKRLDISQKHYNFSFVIFVHRLLMVREACKKNIPGFKKEFVISESNELLNNKELIDSLEKYIERFDKQYDIYVNNRYDNQRIFEKNFYTLDIFYIIIDYLNSCLKDFSQKTQNSDSLKNLKKIYDTLVLNDGFFSADFYDHIQDYRQKVLSNYDKDGNFVLKCIFE